MKLHILNDLHIESEDFAPPATDADAVVLAGDIGVGLGGLHHAYAQNRYEELTGWQCPAAGGPPAKELTPEQRETDREARLTISRETGA